MLLHFGLHRLIGGRVIPTVLAIIVAVIVYGVLILKLGALSEKGYSGASDGNTDIERMSGAEIDASKRRIKK